MNSFLRAFLVCTFTFVVNLHASFQDRYLVIEVDQVPAGAMSLLESIVSQEPEFKILATQIHSNGKSSHLPQAPTDVDKLSTFLTILAEDLLSVRLVSKNQGATDKTEKTF